MEVWKVHKFCESANHRELVAKRVEITNLFARFPLTSTNAEQVLAILDWYIALMELFPED